jgi:hypothetical protein
MRFLFAFVCLLALAVVADARCRRHSRRQCAAPVACPCVVPAPDPAPVVPPTPPPVTEKKKKR